MDTPATLLPLSVVARRLHIPARWLRAEIVSGRVPGLIAERSVVCDPAAVESALLARARATAREEAAHA